MKRFFLIFLFCFSVFTIPKSFADTSRFYKNGKLLDCMYVDSWDGLKIRDTPNLKGNRVSGLAHRTMVKIVELGEEFVIDGIKAPWVKILVPRYDWKGYTPIYGWVAGQYLSVWQPSFNMNDWNDGFLETYFLSCDWIVGNYMYKFHLKNNFDAGRLASGSGKVGTWNVSFDNMKLYIKSKDYCEDYYPTSRDPYYTETFDISIGRGFYCYLDKYVCTPASIEYYLDNDDKIKKEYLDIRNSNLLRYIYFEPEAFVSSLQSKNAIYKNLDFLIESGIYDSSYDSQYRQYWDPIMKVKNSSKKTVTQKYQTETQTSKKLEISDYKKMLAKICPDYFPEKLDEEVHSFDLTLLGTINTNYGKVDVFRSDVVWGYSYRSTCRLVFFLNDKPYGEFYEAFQHETFFLKGTTLEAGQSNYDLRLGIPNQVRINPGEYGLYDLHKF